MNAWINQCLTTFSFLSNRSLSRTITMVLHISRISRFPPITSVSHKHEKKHACDRSLSFLWRTSAVTDTQLPGHCGWIETLAYTHIFCVLFLQDYMFSIVEVWIHVLAIHVKFGRVLTWRTTVVIATCLCSLMTSLSCCGMIVVQCCRSGLWMSMLMSR